MEYISLGGDCAVAYHLQRMGLRTCAYPFDWILTPRIVPLLESQGVDFIQEELLIWKNKTSSFPRIDEDWGSECAVAWCDSELSRVVHKTYKCSFVHDLKDKQDIHNIKECIEKYKRRWERFHQIMKNPKVYKKCFRMGKKEDIETVCESLGYINYTIIQHESIPGTDWKRNDWHWEKWFQEPICETV